MLQIYQKPSQLSSVFCRICYIADNMGKAPRSARTPALSHLCPTASQNKKLLGGSNEHVMVTRQVSGLVVVRSLVFSCVYEKNHIKMTGFARNSWTRSRQAWKCRARRPWHEATL